MGNPSITAPPRAVRDGEDFDLLWTLVRQERRARCSLTRMSAQYETRVFVDDQLVVWRRSRRVEEILALSALWRDRLSASGWTQEVTKITLRPKPDRRRISP